MQDRQRIETWKPRLQALDPWRVMAAGELKQLYAARSASETASSRIVSDLLIAAQPESLKVIFCGARGSGKSTELTWVGSQLRTDFAVVQVDIFPALREGQGTLAILAMLGVAGLRSVELWEHPDAELEWPPKGRAGALVGTLESALAELGVATESLGAWVKGAAGVVTTFSPEGALATVATGAAMLAAGRLSSGVGRLVGRLSELGKHPVLRQPVGTEREAAASGLLDAVQAIYDTLRELSGRCPLLLVDGLDQLDTIDDIRAAVEDAHLLQQLTVPMVFSGPIQLRHDSQFNELPGRFRPEVLHNLAVLTHSAEDKVEEGAAISVLVAAYDNRAAALGLPQGLFELEQLEEIARCSSGIVREFFTLLHDSARVAMSAGADRVGASHVEEALKARRHFHQLSLNARKLEILASVLEHEVMVEGEEAEELLFTNLIACYPNGDLWFRPHELLVSYVEEYAADRAPAKDS